MNITAKTLLKIFIILFIMLFAIPLPAMFNSPLPQKKLGRSGRSFRVFITEKDKTERVEEKDYIIGVLSAEMSAESNKEALKAQAVAAYTIAVGRREEAGGKDYDFTDSPDNFQAYISKDEQKKRFADSYEKYRKIYSDVADAVSGQIMTYNDKPALTLYFDTSAGKTEDAKNVFGKSYPYLKPVQSAGDLLSADYEKSYTFTPSKFKKLLSDCGIKFSSSPEKWFDKAEYSDSGTLLSVKICNKTFKGTDLRGYLSLPSACFDMKYNSDNEKVEIKCRGNGHCVGMSQNGACCMADNGSTYDEILSWYYPSCKLQKANYK